ncbi:MAG: AbrB/MazE/SpoVT family DNA-binding domain-containing protein [Gammaproteobacteria bacterium]|nr:AbrB/MazE/SpoVT family DNA-binding domain-containing protein [Gammaproteobacteria bacterium]HBF07744.1 AbrB/MazE/SpoVT family DNA-binding domain-containing protein [Gammaproteobacteria bacterium]|tara:strand:- start:121 stop:360 length:240 start_codon:yes stop_codon:yes gene_type:complete
MTSVSIRQSNGANIVSIPKSIIASLGLDVGSQLDLTIIENKIVLTPAPKETLEDLLAGSPQEYFQLNEEDQLWMNNTQS